ncbi:AUX/IAA protein [Dioscorea alata]|uniref:AUX/IAA protein n=1 Tax=Dioscorea alata TaxID=55571 RepID=A0ACB7UBQ8_DIOAL|nr:AUX/IAA protein [Dioscorea alata]
MGEELKPKLLDLIPKEREWMATRGVRVNGLGDEVEKRLELRLGLPGGEEAASALTLAYFSTPPNNNNNNNNNIMSNSCAGTAGRFMTIVQSKPEGLSNGKEEQQQQQQQQQEKKSAFSSAVSGNANSSQTRTSNVPIVGWPPIRSFRKNLASTSKPSIEQQNNGAENVNKIENSKKGLFVKINMDGIPIGRKVDLNAYDNYEELSLAVDNLFRGLLSAQKDLKTVEEKQVLTGLLDGSGEYTLVYEDTEGDRMLVGDDVPWNMFVSTAKRLRVLKTSDLSGLSLGVKSRKRTAPESCTR